LKTLTLNELVPAETGVRAIVPSFVRAAWRTAAWRVRY